MAVTRPSFAVPVFAAVGVGAWGQVQGLRGRSDIRLVTSPRQASVLLVAGAVPDQWGERLRRVHDQVPHPRRTVAWTGEAVEHPVASDVCVGSADDIAEAVIAAHRQLEAEPARSEPGCLADEEPNEWRGVGPHGQGGEGMMGGTPYGRPMAMSTPDRDGLVLDSLELSLGPFLDALPGPMKLDVSVQGDVIQAASIGLPVFGDMLGSPLLVDDVDSTSTAVARAELRRLAHALHVHGMDADAGRVARIARDLSTDDQSGQRRDFGRIRQRIRRSGIVLTLRHVGHIDGHGDAADRWRLRLDQIEGSLDGEALAVSPPSAGSVADALVGITVTDAISTLVSVGQLAEASDGLVIR